MKGFNNKLHTINAFNGQKGPFTDERLLARNHKANFDVLVMLLHNSLTEPELLPAEIENVNYEQSYRKIHNLMGRR